MSNASCENRRDKQRKTIRPPTPLSSLAADLDMNLGIRRSPNIKTPRRNLLNALQDSTQTPAIPEEAAMTQSPEGDSIVEDIHNAPTPKLRMSDDSSSSDNMQISPFQFMEIPRFKRSQPFMRSMSESILKSTTTIQTEQPTGFRDFKPSFTAVLGYVICSGGFPHGYNDEYL
ncbi:hypothetical protein BKA69DRAFT_190905 [Paraphysoderma sedebokerense]|nr:hypothetical protein BKA69DRAFT_190905 [Paraphysoderma sedebokerense]